MQRDVFYDLGLKIWISILVEKYLLKDKSCKISSKEFIIANKS